MYYEVIWLGRGGQGAVTASRLLAKALTEEGLWAQSIVFFGAERRGAPVYAYNRISDKPIKYHHFVYKPDIVVVFEDSLLKITNVLKQAKENALIILNSTGDLQHVGENIDKYRVAIVDATGIAIELDLRIAGIPVVNTAMLGAFAKAMGFPSIDILTKVITSVWSGKIGEINAKAAKKAYDGTRIVRLEGLEEAR